MTREEFRIKFSQGVAEDDHPLFDIAKDQGDHIYCDLSNEGLTHLTNIAEVSAEPLFEEIEKLEESEEDKIKILKDLEDRLFRAESDRTFWFDKYNLEMAKNLKLIQRITNLERRPHDDQSTRE